MFIAENEDATAVLTDSGLEQVEELEARGVPAGVHRAPGYVAAGQVVDDVDKFDAAFWGIGPQEAAIMDPQHRLFMEVAWAAVEHAGYAARSGLAARTGVFAASGIDGYLHHHQDGGYLKEPCDPRNFVFASLNPWHQRFLSEL